MAKELHWYYVDDILVLTSDEDNKNWIETVLKDEYKELSVEHCNENGLSYLGMHMMKNTQDDIIISMDGYIDEILKEYQEMSTIHEYVVPAEASLFNHELIFPQDGSEIAIPQQACKARYSFGGAVPNKQSQESNYN